MADAPSLTDYETGLRAGLGSVRRVEIREMDNAGGEYDPNTRTIFLDPFNASLLDGLIHELLHHKIYHRLASWGAGEEPVTEALEDMVVRYINRSKSRRRWWRRAFKAKLAEGVG
jgi:hypothetical protein